MQGFNTSISTRRSTAFTLVEILVVVVILIILLAITVAVGIQVKNNAAIRSTHATLKTLDGMMRDYIAAGNAEPTLTVWPSYVPYAAPNPAHAYAKTKDPSSATLLSDPFMWVQALMASPASAKKLSTLTSGNDGAVTPHTVILDAFGTPIRYIPYNAALRREGYFESAGPDHVFINEDPSQFTPLPPPGTPAPMPDDLFSFDP